MMHNEMITTPWCVYYKFLKITIVHVHVHIHVQCLVYYTYTHMLHTVIATVPRCITMPSLFTGVSNLNRQVATAVMMCPTSDMIHL